jgi:hypothetical protein
MFISVRIPAHPEKESKSSNSMDGNGIWNLEAHLKPP